MVKNIDTTFIGDRQQSTPPPNHPTPIGLFLSWMKNMLIYLARPASVSFSNLFYLSLFSPFQVSSFSLYPLISLFFLALTLSLCLTTYPFPLQNTRFYSKNSHHLLPSLRNVQTNNTKWVPQLFFLDKNGPIDFSNLWIISWNQWLKCSWHVLRKTSSCSWILK